MAFSRKAGWKFSFLFKIDLRLILILNTYFKYKNTMKKINLIIAYLSLLWFSVIMFPKTYNLRWNIAWILLIVIVFSRPLADILPRIWILKKIVCIRKWLWILCWSAALTHSVWYFIFYDIAASNLFINVLYRSVNNLL